MTIKESLEVLKLNGLTPKQVKYNGTGFADDIAYIEVEEFEHTHFHNASHGVKSFNLCQVVYIHKGTTCYYTLTEDTARQNNALVLAFKLVHIEASIKDAQNKREELLKSLVKL
jgi:hypothetical protein